MSNNRIKIPLAFASIYIIWGSTYVALRFGIETIPPFLLSATRFFIAGILLFGYCLLKRKAMPDLKSIFTNGFVVCLYWVAVRFRLHGQNNMCPAALQPF